jgi:Calcineurin-like phosphoesterase
VTRLPIVLAACVALVALGVAASRGSDTGPSAQADTASQLRVVGARVAAAGDIACDPASSSFNDGVGAGLSCRQLATSDLLVGRGYAAVLTLGDLQYEDGAYAKFLASYDRSWGRVKAITRPAPGNHEYETPDARGYYRYFGGAAGRPGMGYHSFELGSWHVIALNSNCADVGGCGRNSPQERWLRADLTSHPVPCTLAYWHHPRFSSGAHGSDASYSAFWKDLYEANAELVLAGHDHDYERFAPQTSRGVLDVVRGLREIVVGTGGKGVRPFGRPERNSEVRDATSLGVLELALGRRAYGWRYRSAVGGFTDSGSSRCH